ncbi:MAG: DUF4412 domain-containing protein [Elusimicrobiales bacterium]|nr:DUF4412 domain-containing protein [Elusimicrobiales bacterium]
MKNITGVFIALAVCASFFARQAAADVVFEEITSQSGMPMGGGSGMKTKVLISGDKYRAQKKLTVDAAAMGDQMKTMQQMGGVNMGMMNQINRGAMPAYPDHIMTLEEWAAFDENKKLIDEVTASSKKKGGLFGQLKKDFSKKGGDSQEKTVEDVLYKYCQEFDFGLVEKAKDAAADKMAQSGGMGTAALAQVADYDTWLRAKIIRDSGPESAELRKQKAGLEEGGFGGGSKKSVTLAQMQKISDDKSPEYAALKRTYEKNSEYKAEYAKAREKNREMSGELDKRMKEGMAGAADAANDMMLNVQIVRLDTGKVIELFPPKKAKDPKPEDVTYKEETLNDLKGRVEEAAQKKAKMMKANEGKMKEADAKMAAARAKYGDSVGGGKPEAKKIGNETVNGIACEHWQVSGLSGVDDYWVSKKFAGADEIMAFEAKLREKVGEGRSGLSFGGMPDMSSMMAGMDAGMDAEVAKIKAQGIVIKHVNTMKNAAPTSGAMVQNQQMMAGDIGKTGASQMAAMKGMDMSAMAKDPAALQRMMASMGQQTGAAAQASADKHIAAGDMNTSDRQDMTSTYELKLVGAGPVPAAAFELPAGAKRK